MNEWEENIFCLLHPDYDRCDRPVVKNGQLLLANLPVSLFPQDENQHRGQDLLYIPPPLNYRYAGFPQPTGGGPCQWNHDAMQLNPPGRDRHPVFSDTMFHSFLLY